MWTVNTQVLTAVIWLIFEMIFSKSEEPLFHHTEIRDLVSKSSRFLQLNEGRSRVAKRGLSLINTLLEIHQSVEQGDITNFDLKNIMSQVELDNDFLGEESDNLNFTQPYHGSVVDWLSRESSTWEGSLAYCGEFLDYPDST